MDYSKFAVLIALLVLLTASGKVDAAPRFVADSDACFSNCVETLRNMSRLLIFARDSNGEVFKTLSLDLPANARLALAPSADPRAAPTMWVNGAGVVNASGLASNTACSNYPGMCTQTTVRTYTTPRQYIFFTYTYIYHDGALLEVQVEETRLMRDLIN